MLKYGEVKKLHIELSSYCNSSCPTCPRNINGGVVNPNLVPKSLSLTDFEKIFDSNFIFQIRRINFCGNYGDPIMCKDLLDILKYIFRSNPLIWIFIHTNGGLRNKDFWNELGLLSKTYRNFRVIFSIDGLEDTNHLYRIGVNWKKLMTNVKTFISAGGKAEWDMLVFQHNQHQVNEARNLADRLGFIKFIEGNPHGFKYNGKIRVVDNHGKFLRFINPSDRHEIKDYEPRAWDKLDFDIHVEKEQQTMQELREVIREKKSPFYEIIKEKLNSHDNVEIKNCLCKDDKEIYVDSNGGVHPCCYLGHINQDSLTLTELVIHKQWIEDNIGIENINALHTPLKDILDSEYFSLIEESWSKTFETGRNPMCVMKCGIQRPNNMIRSR